MPIMSCSSHEVVDDAAVQDMFNQVVEGLFGPVSHAGGVSFLLGEEGRGRDNGVAIPQPFCSLFFFSDYYSNKCLF